VYPGRIVNKTNGITFRRWLHRANPALTAILVDVLGERVLSDPSCLRELANHASDPAIQERLADQRRLSKCKLAATIQARTGIVVNTSAMFDVQIKRIHEYKRQLLNILHTVALYQAIVADPPQAWQPRVKLFAGKAAASYHTAKQIIRLANDIAAIVNSDQRTQGLLQVVFLPDYNVSLAETIIPAADLSEQISTAGMEASGTGNMKLMLNGALTIGTLDGANVEIRDNVGADNIFIFGLTSDEVARRRAHGGSAAQDTHWSAALTDAVAAIGSGAFSPDDPDRYWDLVSGLRYSDWFCVAADFDAYIAAQAEVAETWTQPGTWWRKSILNIAGAGWFSSDRAIAEYARDIWNIPIP
jgi:starch phosphorylase